MGMGMSMGMGSTGKGKTGKSRIRYSGVGVNAIGDGDNNPSRHLLTQEGIGNARQAEAELSAFGVMLIGYVAVVVIVSVAVAWNGLRRPLQTPPATIQP